MAKKEKETKMWGTVSKLERLVRCTRSVKNLYTQTVARRPTNSGGTNSKMYIFLTVVSLCPLHCYAVGSVFDFFRSQVITTPVTIGVSALCETNEHVDV